MAFTEKMDRSLKRTPFTRRHYNCIANVLAKLGSRVDREGVIYALADEFERLGNPPGQRPSFDRLRWLRACKARNY